MDRFIVFILKISITTVLNFRKNGLKGMQYWDEIPDSLRESTDYFEGSSVFQSYYIDFPCIQMHILRACMIVVVQLAHLCTDKIGFLNAYSVNIWNT